MKNDGALFVMAREKKREEQEEREERERETAFRK